MLNNIQGCLQETQTLYIAGGFNDPISETVWFVRGKNKPQPNPVYTCNAEEADTRVWLHATKTQHHRVLVISPDTDTYHIGITIQTNKHILVQVSSISSREMKLIDLTALKAALQNDPDLAGIPPLILPQIMQTLYVCTGCDYISFFSQLGKATFLRCFFKHASFITSGDPQGTLADVVLDGEFMSGYLAFLRLIGTVYFMKYATAFEEATPSAHYHNFYKTEKNLFQQHEAWIQNIRESIWHRTKFENEMPPSYEALVLHWKRSCWVLNMWQQSTKNIMTLPPLVDYGWHINASHELMIRWDTEENIRAVNDRVQLLLRGCKCTTGCTTARCSCKKNKRQCSEGCSCKHCCNIHTIPEQLLTISNELVSEIASEESSDEDEVPDDFTDIIDWVFGTSDEED